MATRVWTVAVLTVRTFAPRLTTEPVVEVRVVTVPLVIVAWFEVSVTALALIATRA